MRFAVLKRDGFACVYCGRRPPHVDLEVDHVHPVVLGGPDDIGNLATSCRDCNGGKGARPLSGPPASVGESEPGGKVPGEGVDTLAEAAARMLRGLRRPTVAMIGPALVYGGGATLSVMVVCGGAGGEARVVQFDLGRLVADALDDPLAAAIDTVLQIVRAGEITMRQGIRRRADFVAEMRRRATRVQDCSSERELIEGYDRTFPGPKSRKVRAAFEAEARQ